jgi:hypothetical protein
MRAVHGPPFGVVASPRGNWAFVSLATGHVETFRISGLVMPPPAGELPVRAQPLGEALTHDGRYLLVATGNGATVISVRRAEQGSNRAVLGLLGSPAGYGR